jgi:hypothetical protein
MILPKAEADHDVSRATIAGLQSQLDTERIRYTHSSVSVCMLLTIGCTPCL